jgi:hypothetical protein
MGQKYKIIVEVEENDGRYFFDIQQPKDQKGSLDIQGIRAVLAGALALTIRGSENEPKAMKEVIDYLNSEFVNTDSFTDVFIEKGDEDNGTER